MNIVKSKTKSDVAWEVLGFLATFNLFLGTISQLFAILAIVLSLTKVIDMTPIFDFRIWSVNNVILWTITCIAAVHDYSMMRESLIPKNGRKLRMYIYINTFISILVTIFVFFNVK